jgi:hypothetical protein
MFIPKEKVNAVIAVLENVETELKSGQQPSSQTITNKTTNLSDDPWQNLLEDDQ